MDKGYDSEAIHRLIREDLHADSIIPIRSWNNEVVGGVYRQEMAIQFDDVRYRKRQLVENKFSVLKRKFGGDLKARIFTIQKKEIATKMIVCNIHRFLNFLVIEVFYRAKKGKIQVYGLIMYPEGEFVHEKFLILMSGLSAKNSSTAFVSPGHAGIEYSSNNITPPRESNVQK